MLLATKRGPAGAYNIAAPGPEPLSKLLDGAGKMHLPLLPPIGIDLAINDGVFKVVEHLGAIEPNENIVGVPVG